MKDFPETSISSGNAKMKMKEKEKNQYTERASYAWSEDSVRFIASPSATAKSIYFYAQEIGYFKTSYPYFTERQNLNSFLIVYTISGEGTLHYHEKDFTLTSGQCFYINCMDYHYYETKRGNDWEFLWIHFNGSNALGYYEEFTKDDFSILDIEESSVVESTLRRILAINQKKDITTEVLTSSLIASLLTEFIILGSTNRTDTILMPEYIRAVMKYTDRNFREPLSLDDLASRYGISKFHLSREFKKHTGTTVNEYIINTRLSYAKELLKYSDLSVNEIAYSAGFHNVSHFINLFKARENMTPLAYRREWKI
ncbi:AraC family transcriptional regulator [Anaerobium acetethylicum]|uniref:AraC-like ligand binding domain-containing protein n=1 Tax=Anaerobium acetethylicum TaxID=1619234 RepID=A0A1D3TRT8_9FIRM|nr:AraC family transcriptional regulator [Anaerobium acetethylicum]SCP96486.1 AraC-like ligand binding domain-containing protein [Anaerobium acetethylicum]